MCFFGGLFFRRREKANSSRTRQHTLSTLVTPTFTSFSDIYIYYLYWQQHCLIFTLGKWAICDYIAE